MICVSNGHAMKCGLENGLSYSNSQEQFLARGILDTVGVQCTATLLKEEDEVVGFSGILRVFPVDVDAVETQVFHELDSRTSKLCSSGSRRSWLRKVDGIIPATDGEDCL